MCLCQECRNLGVARVGLTRPRGPRAPRELPKAAILRHILSSWHYHGPGKTARWSDLKSLPPSPPTPVVHGAGGAATACAPAARAAWPAAWVRVLQYRGPVYGHEMARSVGEIEGGRVGKEGGAGTWQRQDVATIHVDPTNLFDEHGTVAGSMDDAEQLLAV
eukprot:scaffold313_cov91-Phaeocystis_antarctica.AAC.1